MTRTTSAATSLPRQRFLYDGDALVAEYNDGGSMTSRYVHGASSDSGVADTPYVWYTGNTVTAATRRHLFANWQGSVSLITNATGFTVLGINAYDAYGIPNATNIGRFQYTGQIWLPELGLYHYKARIYSPTLGRFLQTDPIGYEDQVNLYAYVGNDPVNLVDPSGLADVANTCSRAGGRSCSGSYQGSGIDNTTLGDRGDTIFGDRTEGVEKTLGEIGHNGGPPINNPPPKPTVGMVLGRIFSRGPLGATVVLSGDTCRSCNISNVNDVLENPNLLQDVTLDAFHSRVGTP